MNSKIIQIGLIIAIVAVGAFAMIRNHNANSPDIERKVAISEEAVSEQSESAMERSPLIDYSPSALADATKNGKKVVIFFHASWCPSCRAAEEDFKAHSEQIPKDVIILKADYDSEAELKRKYGIATQDTFVQIDASGEKITQWISGGRGIQSLLTYLK